MSGQVCHIHDIVRRSAKTLRKPLSSPDFPVWSEQAGLNSVIGQSVFFNDYAFSRVGVCAKNNSPHKLTIIEILNRFIQQFDFSRHSAPRRDFSFPVPDRQYCNKINTKQVFAENSSTYSCSPVWSEF